MILNVNGLQDASEPGISNVVINLYDSFANLINTTTTDSSGNYLFENLAPGDYQIQIILPAGYLVSLYNQGSDEAADSDINTAGVSDFITLASGATNLDVDGGLYTLTMLGGILFGMIIIIMERRI